MANHLPPFSGHTQRILGWKEQCRLLSLLFYYLLAGSEEEDFVADEFR